MFEFMSPPELITGITNLINFFIAIIILMYIYTIKFRDTTKKKLWIMTFIFIAIVGLIGSWAHGLVLEKSIYDAWWNVLGVFMGLMVSSLTVSSFYEKYGQKSLKKIFIINFIAFLTYTLLYLFAGPFMSNNFYIFAIFAAINLLLDLIITISIKNKKPHTYWLIMALITIILGSVIQALRLSFVIFVEVDTNSIYHIALSVSLIFVAISLKKSTENK